MDYRLRCALGPFALASCIVCEELLTVATVVFHHLARSAVLSSWICSGQLVAHSTGHTYSSSPPPSANEPKGHMIFDLASHLRIRRSFAVLIGRFPAHVMKSCSSHAAPCSRHSLCPGVSLPCPASAIQAVHMVGNLQAISDPSTDS